MSPNLFTMSLNYISVKMSFHFTLKRSTGPTVSVLKRFRNARFACDSRLNRTLEKTQFKLFMTIGPYGSRHSSVDPSVPSILWPEFNPLAHQLNLNLYDKRMKINKKRPGLDQKKNNCAQATSLNKRFEMSVFQKEIRISISP